MLYFAGPGDSYLYLCLTLYCLVMGAVTSYARAKAESLGMQAEGGIAERADRIVAILLATGFGRLVRRAGPDVRARSGSLAVANTDHRHPADPDGAQAGAGRRGSELELTAAARVRTDPPPDVGSTHG